MDEGRKKAFYDCFYVPFMVQEGKNFHKTNRWSSLNCHQHSKWGWGRSETSPCDWRVAFYIITAAKPLQGKKFSKPPLNKSSNVLKSNASHVASRSRDGFQCQGETWTTWMKNYLLDILVVLMRSLDGNFNENFLFSNFILHISVHNRRFCCGIKKSSSRRLK